MPKTKEKEDDVKMGIPQPKKVKIPPKKWIQIGGDVSYELYGLILGYYDPDVREIKVVSIDAPTADVKIYLGEEATYDLDELADIDPAEIGIDPKQLKEYSLEQIARSKLEWEGGDPIDCGAGGFLQDLHTEFPNFDTALACAIGKEESFIDYGLNTITPQKSKIKKLRRESVFTPPK